MESPDPTPSNAVPSNAVPSSAVPGSTPGSADPDALLERPASAYPLCHHRGALIPWERAALHANSLALRYALSVFEGIRLYRQADGSGVRAFRLEEHLERLERSLRLTRLPAPPETPLTELPARIEELVAANRVEDDTYLRVSISAWNFGVIATPVTTCLTMTLSRMGRKRWLAEGRGMRLAVSGWRRAPESAFPAAAKNISNYAGPRLASLEARDRGFDDAVLTDPNGFLQEAPTAALFVVRDGVLATPPLMDGVLPSITRQVVLELAGELGLPAREARLSRTDAYLAEEAFLCGTGLELGPVAAFESHLLPPRETWTVTPRIVEAYFDAVRGGRLAGDPDGAWGRSPAPSQDDSPESSQP